MTRVLLLGCAGSGKSTLARRLSEETGAPVIDLDAIWRGRIQETADFRATLASLHAQDAWISDGNFAAVTFDVRMPPGRFGGLARPPPAPLRRAGDDPNTPSR